MQRNSLIGAALIAASLCLPVLAHAEDQPRPYVEGSYTVFVPWTAFQAYLSPEGAAIFGGERPKDDEKRDENG